MADTCQGYADETSFRDIKERLENDLKRTDAHKAKVEAAIRFLAANPDAQALLELIR